MVRSDNVSRKAFYLVMYCEGAPARGMRGSSATELAPSTSDPPPPCLPAP